MKDKRERTVKLIRKSNDLVEGRYRFDVWEMRVFTKMLTMIHRDDEDFKEYRVFLKDVVKDFQLDNKNSYKLLKDGAIGLTKKEIRVVRNTPEGEKEFTTNIAVGVDSFLRNGNYIDISFHPKMKPFLLQLQSQFLMYDIRNVLSIQSSFSVRIYELLKQYETIGKRQFSIQELKETLDVADKYKLYGHFKERVILKAQEDLEKFTDIRFSFEEIKEGRSVTKIIFYISKNEKIIETRHKDRFIDIEIEEGVEGEPEELEIFDMIKKFPNANIATVRDWLGKYSADYVRQRITFVENLWASGKTIKNPIGFIQTMLPQPDLFDPIEEEKQKKKDKSVQKETQIQQRIEEQNKEEEKKKIQKDYNEAKTRFIENIFVSDQSLVQAVLDKLKAEKNAEKPSLLIELAANNYVTNLENIQSASKEEIMYNYKKGGSFGGYLLGWVEENFSEQYKAFRQPYDEKMNAL
jgi:plasmid replication initiation protein